MPDTVEISQVEVPLAALVAATEWTEAASKSSQLYSAQERAAAALESRRAELNALYERAIAPDSGWREIFQVASMLSEWGRAAAEKLGPQIDSLRRKLTDSDMPPEVRRMREESIAVAESWLALYRELHTKLLGLTAERQASVDAFRARPVLGEIDYDELTREIVARFPKILAALAR
jgi:hypothetical protein